MKKSEDYPSVDHQELDRYLGVMFKLLEGFADVEEAEKSLDNFFDQMGNSVPIDIQLMMRELLEEKRKKEKS